MLLIGLYYCMLIDCDCAINVFLCVHEASRIVIETPETSNVFQCVASKVIEPHNRYLQSQVHPPCLPPMITVRRRASQMGQQAGFLLAAANSRRSKLGGRRSIV